MFQKVVCYEESNGNQYDGKGDIKDQDWVLDVFDLIGKQDYGGDRVGVCDYWNGEGED